MSDLDKFVTDSTPWVSIQSGSSKIFTILGYEKGTMTIKNQTSDTMIYQVELEDGSKKDFTSSSLKLARQILALPNKGIGVKVKISREGENFQTEYTVENLSPAGASPEII